MAGFEQVNVSSNIKNKTNKKRRNWNMHGSLWWMYLPALLAIGFFIIYPFFSGIKISLTNWNGFSQTYKYVGLAQYKRMLADPVTWLVVKNTLLYGIGSTVFQNILGLLYALLLNQSIG